MDSEKLGLGSFSKGAYLKNNQEPLLDISIAKQVILDIEKCYGRKFIENIIKEYAPIQRTRYPRMAIVSYYNNLLLTNPTLQKQEARQLTAKDFGVTEYAVRKHIYKK